MTLAEQIELHLLRLVEVGEEAPFPLTLKGIAHHFGASLMPVRQAVEHLVDQGFLRKSETGRLRFNPRRRTRSKRSMIAPNIPPSVSTEQHITNAVVELSLRGSTECLREEVTAAQFGIGRTILRRILSKLAGAGMIEHLPRRGWRVRAYSEKDMLDYIAMRENLELLALDLSAHSLDASILTRLLIANSPDATKKPCLDNRLHQHWIDRANNRYLQEFFQHRGIYYDALFAKAVVDNKTVARRAGEHRDILNALLKNNLPRAKICLAKHIRGQCRHVERLFAERGE